MLTLYEPKYEDLWFRQMMLADEDTMSYNHAWGGTIPFGEDKWRGWYDCWIADLFPFLYGYACFCKCDRCHFLFLYCDFTCYFL